MRNDHQFQIKQEPENEDNIVNSVTNTKNIESNITLLSTLSNGVNIKKEKKRTVNKDVLDNTKKRVCLEQEKVYNKLIDFAVY